MSSLIDKLRTLINSQLRGPRHPRPPEQPVPEPPPAPVSERVPEVTEGRPRKPQVEVVEVTPRPTSQEAPTTKPVVSKPTPPPPPPEGLDQSNVADLLKKKK